MVVLARPVSPSIRAARPATAPQPRRVDQIPPNQKPPGRRGRAVNLVRHQEIHDAFASGKSIAEVAKILGLTLATAYAYHVKYKQETGDESTRHPDTKQAQISQEVGRLGTRYQLRPVLWDTYECFGGPDGDTAKAFKLARCVVENHPYNENDSSTDYRCVIPLNLLGRLKKRHIIDIDPYGWEALTVLEMRIGCRLANKSLLFLTIPKPQMMRNPSHRFRVSQYFGVEDYTFDHVQKWVMNQLAKDSFKVISSDVKDIGPLWRIALQVERTTLDQFMV